MDNIEFNNFLKNLGFIIDPELKLVQTEIFVPIDFNINIKYKTFSKKQLFIILLILCYYDFKIKFYKNEIELKKIIPTVPIVSTFPTFKLGWVGNSCYMDSVLISLFSQPNKLIKELFFEKKVEKKFIKVQDELKQIYKRKNVSELRKTFKNLDIFGYEDFSGHHTRDSGEFLQYLFSIFNIDIAERIEYRQNYNMKNNTKDEIKIIKNITNPIITISLENLDKRKNYNLCSFIKQEEVFKFDEDYSNKKWTHNKNIIKYISPFLVFYIRRNSLKDKFNKINIIPSSFFINNSYDKLYLSSIVVFTGSHYFCFFKYDNIWYIYDDISTEKIKEIGNFEKLFEHKYNPSKYGTLFFYS
jgi:hypothetical protein